jgi:hypothetical protein
VDTIKEIVGSFFGSIRERLGHPLIGAFIIAWAVWNFRVLLVLVGDGDGGWLAKINYLDKQLMVPAWMWVVHGLLVPLAFALVWILVLPPILRWFAVCHLRQVVKTKEAVLAIQDQSPMKGVEVADLRARMRKERQQWEEERAQLLKVIDEQVLEVGSSNRNSPESVGPPGPEPETVSVGSAGKPSRIPLNDPTEEVDPIKRAERLGLRIADAPASDLPITFAGHPVVWPWRLSASAVRAAKLQNGIGDLVSFDEHTLTVLYRIRDVDVAQVAAVAHVLRTDIFTTSVAFDQLRQLGMVLRRGDSYVITSAGRLFLAWLLRAGFEFHVPGISAASAQH